MAEDWNAFKDTKRALNIILDRCSEIPFDSEASEERETGALALRRSMPIGYRPDVPQYCYRVRQEARERAGAFFGDPTI